MQLDDLNLDIDRLADLCRRYGIAKMEVFGSFATGEAGENSDLDILVSFLPAADVGLEFVALQQELESLLGRRVDLLTRQSVEQSPNRYFRRYALANTRVLYEHAA